MPVVNPGDIWMTDFGMAAKVRPALILTRAPAAGELDLQVAFKLLAFAFCVNAR